MTTPQKRPRIRPDQAELIDSLRGRVAFEVEVEVIIDQFFELFLADSNARSKPRWAKQHEVMLNLLRSDLFQFDGEDFTAAYERTMEYHREEMAQQAIDIEEERRIEEGVS